jgi:flagellar basal body-associated protein FliL
MDLERWLVRPAGSWPRPAAPSGGPVGMTRPACILVAVLALGTTGLAAMPLVPQKGETPLTVVEAGAVYVDLEPFAVPVFHDNRLIKQITFAITLEVSGPEGEAEVVEKMVYLRDAFLKSLHRLVHWNARRGQSFDADMVKRRLLADCERVLGPGVVRAVLIQGAFEQPFR